jgi:hypothetical protein
MSLESTESKIVYTGDGVTVAFPYPYLFYADSDLKVYLDNVLQTITTNYTIGAEDAGDPNGGTVTMNVAPAVDAELVIDREVDETQPSDYKNYNRFPAEVIEKNLDRLTMMVQKHSEEIGRSLLQPIGETGGSIVIPAYEEGKCWKWDTTENELINSTFDPDEQQQSIEDAQAAQAAAEAAAADSADSAAESAASAAEANTSATLTKFKNVEVNWASVSTLTVKAGTSFRGVDSGTWFTIPSDRTFDITTSGVAGGLDTGSEANSTVYYLLGIGDTTGTNAPHVLGVTEATYNAFTTGNLPSGYDDYKRINYFHNNGAGDIEHGVFVDGLLTYGYQTEDVVDSTSSATFESIDFSGKIPNFIRRATTQFDHDSTSTSEWRLTGGTHGIQVQTSDPAGAQTFDVTLDGSQTFEARVTAGTLTMRSKAIYDNLEIEGQ